MCRALLAVLVLLGVTACTAPASDSTASTTSGNVVDTGLSTAAKHPHWFTGQLVVEPAGRDRACLLLVTARTTYALRSVKRGLEPVAWETDGAFDATRSGIARDGRLVAPYADERTSVRGGVAARADAACPGHRTLAFSRVVRGTPPGADRAPTSPTVTAEPGPETTSAPPDDAPDVGFTLDDPVWLTGRLVILPGNQGDEQEECLGLDTAQGAYSLGSSTRRFDVVTARDNGAINRRATGIHIAGRNSLGMAATYGQRVELLGTIMGYDGYSCSAYPSFAMTDLR